MKKDKSIDLKKFFNALDESLSQIESGEEKETGGIVISSQDGIICVEGLKNLRIGEIIRIEDAEAMVMQVERDISWSVAINGTEKIRAGLMARPAGKMLSIGVSSEILGRVVNPLGEPVDGGRSIPAEKQMPIEKKAPDVMQREPVKQPLRTGILAIDSLVPIGRGQRELIIGDRQTGKTTVAIDAITNQENENVICVYVAVGQREASVARVYEELKKSGALKYSVIVDASASSPAVMQFLAPYAGSAIAEYFMEQGKDVLVVYDDLSKHAVAYREVSLLLRRPPGREAYPGDVFYLHSRLLERAAKLDKEHGGGSITALPIIETQAGDVSAYIPTNVISITDGQIFLDTQLFYKGIRPAIDVGISVSRVGGSAQTKAMKKISGSTKLDLAQYYELSAFSQFASELDAESKKQLVRGERLVEAMKQKAHKHYSLSEEVLVLFAVSRGYFDSLPAKEIGSMVEKLLSFSDLRHKDTVETVEKEKEITEKTEKNLQNVMEEFVASLEKPEEKEL